MSSTTKETSTTPASSRLPESRGGAVCRWIERFLVHSEGDHFGKPFHLEAWQRRWIFRLYEVNPGGGRRWRRALWGLPKGNGKTELLAAIALYELAGDDPVLSSGTPDIVVGAASFEQANLLFGAARTMAVEGRLGPFVEAYDTEILLKNRPGRMYRVAAAQGTNEGRRPSLLAADELHEWEGRKERVHLILANGLAKRHNSLEVNISTAGWEMDSLCGRLYLHGRRVAAVQVEDPTFLFEWWEAGEDADLTSEEGRRAAVLAANPAAASFLDVENVLRRFHEIPEFEWRRYHLNQWTTAPDRWLPAEAWDATADPSRRVADGTPITVGFDGSYSGDSTAIVGCTLDGHLFVVDAWEKPEGESDWRVDILDVEHTIRQACTRWDVRQVACDPFRWQRTLKVLEAEGLPMAEWPSHSPSWMVPACSDFYDAVVGGKLTHDGDDRLATHVANAVVKIDSRGPRIVKDHRDSERHIDLAVAAVIAHDVASKTPEPRRRPRTGFS